MKINSTVCLFQRLAAKLNFCALLQKPRWHRHSEGSFPNAWVQHSSLTPNLNAAQQPSASVHQSCYRGCVPTQTNPKCFFLLLITIWHLLPHSSFHVFSLYNFALRSWGGAGFELISWFLWDYNPLTDRRKCFIQREGSELELLLRACKVKNLFKETNEVLSSPKAFSVKGEKTAEDFCCSMQKELSQLDME